MAKKQDKKEDLRRLVIKAAKIYGKHLAGKVFLYVYGDNFFEIQFKTDRFMHLTGVNSKLGAKDFYNKAKTAKLGQNQFYFSNTHPFGVAKKKLPCLIRLPELTSDGIYILKDMSTKTITYKIGITNLDFTLGVTENIDATGKKLNGYYVPRTLRVRDKASEKSGECIKADFIFQKDSAAKKYNILNYREQNKEIPKSVFKLINPEFYMKEKEEALI